LVQSVLELAAAAIGFEVHDGARGEIHEQQAAGTAARIVRKDDPGGGEFQFVHQARGHGRGEECVRQMQCGSGRSAYQSFVSHDAASADIDNGLEDRVQPPFGDQGSHGRYFSFALGVGHGASESMYPVGNICASLNLPRH
jgi:hypothetical protein